MGGDTFMQTVPLSWKYAELVFSLAEKVDGAVSVKYQLPGEELDPDSLISVSDDSDLQVGAAPTRAAHLNTHAACWLGGGQPAARAAQFHSGPCVQHRHATGGLLCGCAGAV